MALTGDEWTREPLSHSNLRTRSALITRPGSLTHEPIVEVCMPKHRICSIESCDNKHVALGFCSKHWQRSRKHGTPNAEVGERSSHYANVAYLLKVVLPYQGKDCFAWPFGESGSGYAGSIQWDGKRTPVQRIVCELKHGEPKDGDRCRHLCGNGHLACVNPNHLAWGTPLQDRSDMVSHGRSTRGERHSGAKITEQQVRQIRCLKGSMVSREVGLLFGIGMKTVQQIWQRKSWAWLD